jgi:hypothetical protein
MVDFSGFPTMAAERVDGYNGCWSIWIRKYPLWMPCVNNDEPWDDDCEIFGRSNAHCIVGNKVYDMYMNLMRSDALTVLAVPRFFFIKWRCLCGYNRSQPTYVGIDSGTVKPFVDLMHTGFLGNKVFNTNLARSDASTDLEVLRWVWYRWQPGYACIYR